KLLAPKSLTEADIKGSLIEALRLDQTNSKTSAVSPNTYNQRLTTVRQFLCWHLDVLISQQPYTSKQYEYLRERKSYILRLLDNAFIASPPQNKSIQKGLNDNEAQKLITILEPNSEHNFGRDKAVQFRNYISVAIMLYCGLRPGELLSLKVEDIELGAISSIKVERRPPDLKDTRKPRPRIKRNGRVIPIDNRQLCNALDEYIMVWREQLEEKSDKETDYLILSDEGIPLSQASITQFFQILRSRFASQLPENLTAKSLRHTFSSRLERTLRQAGMDEQRRREALAFLRGDSSLNSQDAYIAQEIEEEAVKSLKKYQQKLLAGHNA
ncbi:MAG TPA: integrase, partial [Gammaproteobacteria bacterium]|nr:integrase [Gammaproteobacteria bacterium]